MQHVQRVVGKDGIARLYLRKKGYPRQRLVDDVTQEQVDQLITDLTPSKPLPGTLRPALRAYELENDDFLNLAESTKYEYRLILKEFELDLGKVPLKDFTAGYVQRLKQLWARRGHRAANVRLVVLRNVLKPCMIDGLLEGDPFPLVGQVRRPRHLAEPHPVWMMDVVETVIGEAIRQRKFGLARAVAIGRFVGPRREDIVALRKTARANSRFRFLSGKRRVLVDQEEDPRLTAWLAATPDKQPAEPRRGRKVAKGAQPVRSLTLVYNLAGAPYTADGLAQELAKLVSDLADDGKLDHARYDLHGLRHTRGVEAALAGCSDAQGAALMGHKSPSSFAQYRRQADKIRLADDATDKIARLREHSSNRLVKNEMEKGCKTEAANESGAA